MGGFALDIDDPSAVSPGIPGRPTIPSAKLPAAQPVRDGGSKLVPDLPPPFLASVEGQVAKVLATTSRARLPAIPEVGPAMDQSASLGRSAMEAGSPAPAAGQLPNRLGQTHPRALRLSFAGTTGAAARLRGTELLLVFDEGKAIDLLSSSDPVFAKGRTLVGQGFTRMVFDLPPNARYRLDREDADWSLTIGGVAEAATPIAIESRQGGLAFDVLHPGKAIVVPDPDTGAPLLVGTARASTASVGVARSSALFALDRTSTGVLVEPFSGHLLLTATTSGFLLTTDDASALHLPEGFLASRHAGDIFSRLLDLPSGSVPELSRRLRAELEAAATTPVRDRYEPRIKAVETLVSLGLGPEAGTLLDVAAADDPASAGDPRFQLLSRIVSVLDPARPVSAAPVQSSSESVRLPDDVALWNVLAPVPGQDTSMQEAARVLRSEIQLYLSSPSRLQALSVKRVADLLLASGTIQDLRAVALLPDGPGSVVAKAVALERLGSTRRALDSLAVLENSRDPLVAASALRKEIAIRVRHGSLEASKAADLLARHRLDWRLTGQETDALLEEARDRLDAHQFLRAFSLWREARRADPGSASRVAGEVDAALMRLGDPRDAAAIPASDFVAITDDYSDLIRSDAGLSARMSKLLADKFDSLGLPGRAADALSVAIGAAKPGSDRGAIELRVAGLRLDEGNPAAAATSLQAADQDGITPDLAERREHVRAAILAAEGHNDEALTALNDDKDPTALDLRAKLLQRVGDWRSSESVLKTMVQAIPARGTLSTRDGNIVLRLASAAAHVDDGEEVRLVATRFAGRLSEDTDRSAVERLARIEPDR